MTIADGASYAPVTELRAVVEPGEFNFAAAYLDHGHIYGQVKGLLGAGATLSKVYDPDPAKLAAFCEEFPQVNACLHFEDLLADQSLHLIAAAAIPDQRADIGAQVMASGKHYFTDKSPFTTLEQLTSTRQRVAETGKRYFVYYSERIHNEAAWHAGEMVAQGAVGEVIQVLNVAPHRLAADTRPDWFFQKQRYGGIITDIGSHQVEQFLTYSSCVDAQVNFAAVRNQSHPETPQLEDFGEFSLSGTRPNLALDAQSPSFYARVDWYTPKGSPVWGDGRTFILGTQGSIEVRKYMDVARTAPASTVFYTSHGGVEEIDCLGQVGYPFFGQLIVDVLNNTEHAMSQAHIFKAAEISLRAQALADKALEANA